MKELSDIVRQVVMDYFADKLKHDNKKKLAILLEYPSMYEREIWDHMRELSRTYELQLILGEAWCDIPQDLQHLQQIALKREHQESIIEMITASERLYIPNGSYALLAKLALMIDDDLASWITIQMQLRGKPIAILSDWLLPVGKNSLTAPPKLLAKIKNYQKQLRDEGIQFIHRAQILSWADKNENKSSKRKVVLARHIEESVQNGVFEWMQSHDEIITPLARDRARELGLQIHRKADQEAREGRS